MKKKSAVLDLLIQAVLKLDSRSGERQNVLAFVQSCYCCRVRYYDLDMALASLDRLSDDEQHVLIEWIVAQDSAAGRRSAAA